MLRTLGLLVGFLALVSSAQGQQNMIVVTKTLLSNAAHRECLGLSDKQTLRYWYRAESAIDFEIQAIEGKEAQVPVRQKGQALGTGTLVPKSAGDVCLVWTNLSRRPVLFRFEIARLAR